MQLLICMAVVAVAMSQTFGAPPNVPTVTLTQGVRGSHVLDADTRHG